jgi:hypothetical protein
MIITLLYIIWLSMFWWIFLVYTDYKLLKMLDLNSMLDVFWFKFFFCLELSIFPMFSMSSCNSQLPNSTPIVTPCPAATSNSQLPNHVPPQLPIHVPVFFLYFFWGAPTCSHVAKTAQGLKGTVPKKKCISPIKAWIFIHFLNLKIPKNLHDVTFNP